jgi:aryl-alcohol dehydrogenase-like predicted oxidoreductase
MEKLMFPALSFGRTGHESTRTIFGAAAFWDAPKKAVDATMELVLQNGVNHVDVAASYGKAEQLLGIGFDDTANRFSSLPRPANARS